MKYIYSYKKWYKNINSKIILQIEGNSNIQIFYGSWQILKYIYVEMQRIKSVLNFNSIDGETHYESIEIKKMALVQHRK